MLQEALRYGKLGWSIFPVHSVKNKICSCNKSRCSRPGKHPVTKFGLLDASNDPVQIKKWWTKYPNANIAVATGKASSGLLVIDIDNKPELETDLAWDEICRQHNYKPDTLEAISGGGGKHVYFWYAGVEIRSGTNIVAPGIDVRADGGYLILPPSSHVSGNEYYWDSINDDISIDQVPNWLIQLCTNKIQSKPTKETDVIKLDPEKVQSLRSALAFVNADDRTVWLMVGAALKSTYGGDQAFGIWTEWSQKSDKYDSKDQISTWKTLEPDKGVTVGTIYHYAIEAGWIEPATETPKSNLNHVSLASKKTIQTPNSTIWKPPGILGEISDYIFETAIRPQRAFALSAAITLCGTVLGRKYAGETDLRTNIYIISVGDTASGKDYPRKAVKEILITANLTELLGGENIASGQAILSRLSITPSVIFQLDEFGLLMQSIKSKGSGRHSQEILDNLMKLFSSANTVYISTEYADQNQRPRISIDYPCININATTTAGNFYKAMSSAQVISGYLNRFLVIDESDTKRPRRTKTRQKTAIPDSIIAWIDDAHSLRSIRKGGSIVGINLNAPFIVKKDREATELFDAFEDEIEFRMNNTSKILNDIKLLARSWEHADKLALISAIGDNVQAPKINKEHAEWAIEFVRYHTDRLILIIRDRIADSEFEQDCNDYYLAIMHSADNGITKREMGRVRPFAKHQQRDRAAIIKSLKDAGKIDLVAIPKNKQGRLREAYVAIEIVKE